MADPSTYRPAPGTIPTEPGVYRFSDEHGQVIYVGKAKNLRNRLNSYFQDISALHPRTQRMVTTAAHVQWTVVQNELESLQLEYTWIKEYDPRFNVMYRDDKTYPWLCVTWSDEIPRVFVGRGAHRRGWRYFGPFGQAWAIRDTMETLLRVFPMRSCSTGVFNRARSQGRPCLLGYIGKCSAPCVGRITPEAHREIAEDFCSFMAGRSTGLVRRIEGEMEQASENLEFEKAAVLRDSLEALTKATERNAIVLGDGTDADVIALALDPLEVAVKIFHVRGGRVRGERGWVADRADAADDADLMEHFLLQLYGAGDVTQGEVRESGEGPALPRLVLVSHEPASLEALAGLLSEARGSRVEIRVPRRGDKRTLMDTVTRNAEETLAQHKLKRASDLATRTRALEEIQEVLGLDRAPLRMESYDISHIQGRQVVGSMVVFEDGMPRKSEYRRFIIKSFDGSDDFAAMHEVLSRRLRRLVEDREAMAEEVGDGETGSLVDPSTGAPRKFAYAPHLIVVDGGAPQVHAAQEVLEEYGLSDEIALCGLAKRLEEVWLPDEEWPVILPRTSEGLYLLQRLRDEAHRFAITFHRSRRSKAMVESLLDDVPGLGETRRKTLLAHFGSLRALRRADAEEIARVPGFGPVLAGAVVDALSARKPEPAVNTATGEILDDDPSDGHTMEP
ncbi:excinuclease ABC subunit C [Acidipropionibacterium acidipropionici ATCC 4875]|uniref:UvrABC system protein C n=1 Tax=Acidipropionibacterium acidipropionici (strain ATCC 4875 / DSM 20272 / JCM 6432 / NBRC 12425 / NCIMB 8070 / 4) TaxID=1171373 RepID=K7RRZ0_ACIA4|nr:excinuclease ABC subunit UvrC [Acidipropionibacterium acidipropionici]AFV89136.1 excinuclease ABC subunit C [Acidipropionibacterium acidipropionici ATCC 4875]